MACHLSNFSLRVRLRRSFLLENSLGVFMKRNLDHPACCSRYCTYKNRGIYSQSINESTIVHPNRKYVRSPTCKLVTPSVTILSRFQSNGTFDRDNPTPRKVTPVFLAVPNPFKVIRNWMFGVLIRAYFDPDFTFKEFTDGAKQGLSIISKEMASGELDNISDMVSPKLLPELRGVIERMSLAERTRLTIPVNDILYTFPQNITVHYDDEGGKFLYILMRFWCLSSYTPEEDSEGYSFKVGSPPPGVSEEEFNNRGSIISCTYEFLREVTPGVPAEWRISHIQHGKQINLEARGFPPT